MNALTGSRSAAGATLTELIVALAVVTVVGVALAGSFVYLTRAIQEHRRRTVAITLSQEQVETLKAQPYFAVIATSTPSYRAEFSPPLPYDTALYPPQSIAVNGIQFVRLTYVDRVIESGGKLLAVPYDSLDTGIKRITVHTLWQTRSGWHKYTVINLLANDSAPPTARFQGTVTDASGAPIAQANVFTSQNAYFHSLTDATGAYGFAVTPGSYTLSASAPGYFRKNTSVGYVMAGSGQTVNFTLLSMSSGSISGSVYINRHLVVSQVVASTFTPAADLVPRDLEYVELFNPTTFPINVGYGGTPLVQLSYKGQSSSDDSPDIPLVYVSTYVKPGGYYLIASATSFLVLGNWVTADAYYNSLYADVIKSGKAGAIQLSAPDGTILDGVGWSNSGSGANAPWSEGAAIPQPSGLQSGDQLVRLSSAGALSATFGRAYDPGDNSLSFGYRGGALLPAGGIAYSPLTESSPAQTVIAGAPAYGAVVTANDGLSTSTTAWKALANGYPYAAFSLVGVATGTWTVDVSSSGLMLAISGAAVPTQGTNVSVPNAATTPAWPASNVNNAILSSSTAGGFVGGRVTSATGAALSGVAVNVEPAGSGVTDSQGRYVVAVPAGTYSVIANPGSASLANYGSASLAGVVVADGQYSNGNDLVLSGAGAIAGYVCDYNASNPYPGVTVTAQDALGNVWGQAVTGADGTFLITDLSTGTYSVSPVVDAIQVSSPSVVTLSVGLGATVHADTFTLTGAYGVIAGSVTLSGAPLTTGVLIVATTGTISTALPPSVSSASLSDIPYYMTSSLSDGTFALRVRATGPTTSFNLYGWYAPYVGDTLQPLAKKSASVTVNGGQTTQAGLQWP